MPRGSENRITLKPSSRKYTGLMDITDGSKCIEAKFYFKLFRASAAMQYWGLRPWLYADFVWYYLSAVGRRNRKCLKLLHGFTENVRNRNPESKIHMTKSVHV